ncbi:polysaccharide deacetylase family protein [Paracoccus aestuariivivens]|uniref:Polysaccharide deacetylase family protein n=1 Tax=Paracoccus aestuariivivens TaxID=1820333 RepID=A0A6L6JCH8_9RHOB|nr:polysaccharide deacetylase family protein [Paracoccus aestuariivivens]MTH77894.1 polysaccharide deacetylase family protein [Paracoccus aestuariivivens]
MNAARHAAGQALAMRATSGRPLQLWWRDDDAVAPSPALDRLLRITETDAPLTLAVIPAPWDQPPTGTELAERLADQPHVHVAVHGWSHLDHAAAGAKKQELAPHRAVSQMRTELRQGLAMLRDLHGKRALPLLVPPWNRIANDLLPHLAQDGFTAISTYGPEQPVPGLRVVNTHLDVIDWRGGRIARDPDAMWHELETLAASPRNYVGVLTHHLVHCGKTWAFLSDLISVVRDYGGEWRGVEDVT